MNLRKGDMMIQSENTAIIGLLLGRKNNKWEYLLTSPGVRENVGKTVSSLQRASRDSIINAYLNGNIKIVRKGIVL
tara:strand:+ start:492 stop:719 length:228 start_codon:yes stop_codon:yes gene_type:complete